MEALFPDSQFADLSSIVEDDPCIVMRSAEFSGSERQSVESV